eukprot:CAMPEP_0174259896 /NCGR_PEP_ID=MMETSP0439-20130205/8661_1 /TAXON_ID=0 /ORGANISM="Stereomyxa ramosa, Strain Chinc5" /LENGTH=301 /DNA_ID=CAMNT_0015343973 /DNA_START=594 /DNA_END=1499 /DNA_ORIENTATION=+
MPEGIDFFYSHRSHASKFVDFLQQVVPVRCKTSEKLISSDANSNVHSFNYTFSVEICPVCRFDLVCLPKRLATSLGVKCPLMLCLKVSSQLHMIDPNTLQVANIGVNHYWKDPFRAIANTSHLTEYIVLDINLLGHSIGKFALADVQVARLKDFGHNDKIFLARTFLGNILNPGDYALGYDITSLNPNEADTKAMQGQEWPDVVLVRKSFHEIREQHHSRYWVLKMLNKEEQDNIRKNDLLKNQRDFEQFLRDLEEDPDFRSSVNLYKAPGADAPMTVDDYDIPQPTVDELIDEIDGMNLA